MLHIYIFINPNVLFFLFVITIAYSKVIPLGDKTLVMDVSFLYFGYVLYTSNIVPFLILMNFELSCWKGS